jgi:Holliday junction resolvase RusA-like endonuclease
MTIPLEFTVTGRPGTVNDSSTTSAWRNRVEAVALLRVADQYPLDVGLKSSVDVTIKIFSFPSNRKYADVDNSIKPTIDGVRNALLKDDKNVQRVVAERFFPVAGPGMKVLASDVVTLGPVLMAQANASKALLSAVVVQASIPLLPPAGRAATDGSYAMAIKVEPYVSNNGNFW